VATVLSEPVWRERQAGHQARVDTWTAPVLERASRGEDHPVEDFLFTYYSQRPSHLRRWSPGAGVGLAGAVDLPGPWVEADDGWVLDAPPERLRAAASRTLDLLERTAARRPQFGCFGLHEWAMVHGSSAQEVRHTDLPLRLGAEGTTALLEELPLRCSHVDAFRFFTASARSRNAVQLTREDQPAREQGGCLHANMDLYKWAYKLSPWVASELVADCFDLARRVRVLDMRASPYDVSGLGHSAVPVETEAGRVEYVAAQRGFAAEAAVLRTRLIQAVRPLV
jgi:hypothetical protein